MANVQQVRQSMPTPPILVIQKFGNPEGHHATSFIHIYTKDLAAVGVLRDGAAYTFDESQICCAPFPHTLCLGGSVHRSEDDVRLLDSFLHIGREEQILATACLET